MSGQLFSQLKKLNTRLAKFRKLALAVNSLTDLKLDEFFRVLEIFLLIELKQDKEIYCAL